MYLGRVVVIQETTGMDGIICILRKRGRLSRILDFIEMDVFLELGFVRGIWRGEE